MSSRVASYSFDNVGDYTLDAELEISGGLAQLKDLRPSGATIFADFETDEDANWSDGDPDGTLIGGATVAGGVLDLIGGTKFCDYNYLDNIKMQQTGCVRLVVIPNYSGTPGTFQNFYFSGNNGANQNQIGITHNNVGGDLIGLVRDSAGTNIYNVGGAWSPTLGQSYEIELNFDATTGEARMFVDGVQLGATQTFTGTRTLLGDVMRIGGGKNANLPSNFECGQFIIFDSVQHTANYTPGEIISPTPYAIGNNIQLNPNNSVRSDNILEIDAFGNDPNIRIIFEVNGVKFWYNAGTPAWELSDGTFPQANDFDLTGTVLEQLINSPADINTFLVWNSVDGSTQISIDLYQYIYSFAGAAPSLSECLIYGYVMDIADNRISDVEIKASAAEPVVIGDTVVAFRDRQVQTTSNGQGYFELTLYYDVTSPDEIKWVFDGYVFRTDWPKQSEVAFGDLTVTARE